MKADDATVIGFEHTYDKVGNPRSEIRIHQSSQGDEYTYDAMYRPTRTVYGEGAPAAPPASA